MSDSEVVDEVPFEGDDSVEDPATEVEGEEEQEAAEPMEGKDFCVGDININGNTLH